MTVNRSITGPANADRSANSREVSGGDISSREMVAGVLGATVGATVLWLASAAALNRGLVMAALVTGGLTLWSAIDWRESSIGGRRSKPGPTPRPPDPTEQITDPGTDRPEPPQPSVGPNSGTPARSGDGAVNAVEPTTPGFAAEAAGAVADLGSGHVETLRLVQLDDLLNDRPVRELQCGSCASFEVGIVAESGAGDRSALVCRACAATTELDRTGHPHPVRVRSNPERAAIRHTTTATATHTNSTTTKEQS